MGSRRKFYKGGGGTTKKTPMEKNKKETGFPHCVIGSHKEKKAPLPMRRKKTLQMETFFIDFTGGGGAVWGAVWGVAYSCLPLQMSMITIFLMPNIQKGIYVGISINCVWITGVLGNLAVIYVMMSSKRLRNKPINMFIIHQSFVDMLGCIAINCRIIVNNMTWTKTLSPVVNFKRKFVLLLLKLYDSY